MEPPQQSESTTHRADSGRWRPTLRVVAFVPAFVLANLLTGGLALAALYALFGPAALRSASDFASWSGLLFTVAAFVAAVGTVYVFRRWLDRASVPSLGLDWSRPWLGELLAGFLVGGVLMSLIVAVEALTGGYAFVPGRVAGGAIVSSLGLSLVVLLLVGIQEEVVSRGYVLQNLEHDWGLPVAILVSSILFATAHLGNPAASITSMVGLIAAGVLLAAGYVATRALWLPIGLHWSWNLFEGPVYGFAVSGLPANGLLEARPVGPDWLTGGAFGPEASLVAVGVEALGTVALLAWAARRQAMSDE